VTLPLLHSAAGRIFAAFMPRRIVERHLKVLNRPTAAHERRGSIRYDDIEPELGEIRRAGFAISKGEVLRGVSATAVPLLAAHGQLVGALAVIGQHDSLEMSADGRITRALKRVSTGYYQCIAAKGNVEC
jgi:DNA-binding IclR family transcriptional regulator